MRATQRRDTGAPSSVQSAAKRIVSEDIPLPSGVKTSVTDGSAPGGSTPTSHRSMRRPSSSGSRVEVVM